MANMAVKIYDGCEALLLGPIAYNGRSETVSAMMTEGPFTVCAQAGPPGAEPPRRVWISRLGSQWPWPSCPSGARRYEKGVSFQQECILGGLLKDEPNGKLSAILGIQNH